MILCLVPALMLLTTPNADDGTAAKVATTTTTTTTTTTLPTPLVPDLRNARGIGVRYGIVDGKLWRQRDEEDAASLFGNGQPPDHQRPLVAVIADEANHFITVTDDGLMQHHDDNAWDTLWGLPPLRSRRTTLALPVALTSLRPGRIAYSQRHENVGYYEDTVGSQFNWGIAGCTSVYVLSEDGRQLLFADPWIPADFSREVMLPIVDGEMVLGTSIAASASTLFLMAPDGGLYVRFDDYDHNGGTPFYKYRYHLNAPHGLAGSDPASELQVRALPGFGWEAIEAIPLEGAARLSRRIAVVQTGEGNDARLLQVVGDDVDGHRGVYERKLLNDSWHFRAADVGAQIGAHFNVDDSEWLSPRAVATVPRPRLSYAGFVEGMGDHAFIAARTDDFWFHDGRFTLTLMVGDDDVEIVVDVVDAWTLFQNENAATEVDGVKSLKATLHLKDPEKIPARARQVVERLLGEKLDIPFAAAIVASQDTMMLAPVGYPWNVPRGTWRLALRGEARAATNTSTHMNTITAKAFVPMRGRRVVVDDETYDRLQVEAQLARLLETALPVATSFADVLTVITTTRWTLPTTYWLVGLEEHLPAVLAAQRLSSEMKARAAIRRQEEARPPDAVGGRD